MKIKKLQGGGVAPFMTYTPNVGVPDASTQQAASTSTAGSTKQEDTGLLNKEMIKLITENGIPSDVEEFMNQIGQFGEGVYEGMSGMDTSQIYNALIPKLAKIKFNKEQLTKTTENLYKNDGINEIAVTTNGGVVAKDEKGNVNIISLAQYSQDPEKFSLVTNNEVMKMRSYDKNLAFNNNIVEILQNGKGLNEITKELQGVVKEMKVQKQKKQEFFPADQIEVLKGIDSIRGVGEVKTSQESARVYKEHAKEYLWNMLPQNSKNLIKIKAVQRGITPKDMIELLILPSTEENINQEVDIEGLPGSKSGSGSGSGGSTRDLEFSDMWVGNKLSDFKQHEFNLGNGYSMSVPSQQVHALISTKDKKVLPPNSSLATIANEAFATIGDANNIYFGDEKVTFDKLSSIVSTGQSISKAYMPLDMNALQNGQYKPDLHVAEKLKVVADRIQKERPQTEDEKYLIYRDEGLDEYYGDAVSNPYFAPFAVVQAVSQGEGILNGANKEFFNKVDPKDDKFLKKLYLEGISGGNPTKETKDLMYEGIWDTITKDTNFYTGLAFIHTPDNQRAASAAGNYLTVPKSFGDYQTVEEKRKQNELDMKKKNAMISTNILNR